MGSNPTPSAPDAPLVALEPLPRCLPGFLRVMAPWSVVVVGRRVCVVAQRVPPLVELVRWIAARRQAALWTADAATDGEPPHSAAWTS